MPARIYTRSGDTGETGLFGGRRVSKDDLRVEAYGAVDELNAALGVARTHSPPPDLDAVLLVVQNTLFRLGADLATPQPSDERNGRVTIERIGPERAEGIENWIDHFESELPALTSFIVPGGSPAGAALHFARTVCRRAERRCVALAAGSAPESAPNPEIVRYLNRLSDLLFVLARVANSREGVPDVVWTP